MCFMWISEQKAIISLYNINWLVFITDMESLLRDTELVFKCTSSLSQSARVKVCALVSSVCCNAASRIDIFLYRCTLISVFQGLPQPAFDCVFFGSETEFFLRTPSLSSLSFFCPTHNENKCDSHLTAAILEKSEDCHWCMNFLSKPVPTESDRRPIIFTAFSVELF
jgi:hypothetical protein